QNFLVKIITPEKLEYEQSVKSVTFTTHDGEITILPLHENMITAITSGELRVQDTSDEVEAFFVDTGIAKMIDNELVVLIDALEDVESLNINHAEDAYQRARLLRENAIKTEEIDFTRFEAMLERELGRVRVARKY